METYFYYKNKKKIEPVKDPDLNKKAKIRLQHIYENKHIYKIPSTYIDNWESVALYDPKGNVDNAKSPNPANNATNIEPRIVMGGIYLERTFSIILLSFLKPGICIPARYNCSATASVL